MSVVTRFRFSDIVVSNNDSILTRAGSIFLEAKVENSSNSYISIHSKSNSSPIIESKGLMSDVGIDILTKGNSALIVKSNDSPGKILLQNTSGYGMGFEANVLTSSSYTLKLPSRPPQSEMGIKVDKSGNMDFFAIGAVSSTFDLYFTRQKKNGSEYSNALTTFGLSLLEYNFDMLQSFTTYHQNFLNGILQFGKEMSQSSAQEMSLHQIDYMFENSGKLYFLQEDIDDNDIIVVFGNERS